MEPTWSPERWRAVGPHFERALEVPPEDRPEEADRHGRRAPELAEGFRGQIPHSSFVGLSQTVLGEVDLGRGGELEAKRRFREALAHMQPTLGETHSEGVKVKSRLAGEVVPEPSGARR